MHLAKDQHGRVLVLSMASFAEECLGRLIRAFLRDVRAADELLEGFNAPLGTFAARTKLCHAMGLLTDGQFSDLELARKIRNEFAHAWDECSFADEKIKAWVDALKAPRLLGKESQSPEDKFRMSISGTLIEIEVLQNQIEKEKRRLSVIGLHLGKPEKKGSSR
jgi:DNA-binding MltR family transcriptional regulator